MILQALKEYYDRLARDPGSDIPRFGYSREKIRWAIVIDREGNLVPPVLDLRETNGRKPLPREMIVPQRVKKSVNVAANFLWGDTGSTLGMSTKKYRDSDRPHKDFVAFCEKLQTIGGDLDDDGMRAILAFAKSWNPADVASLENWDEIVDSTVVFRLDGDRCFIHDRQKIRDAYAGTMSDSAQSKMGICLVTGEETPMAVIHPAIHGVRGAQSSGANIVSFNQESFRSYGKEQGANAPVGEYAAFAYTTALNWLLRSGSSQKIQIADATTVFWAERPSLMERSLFSMFNPPSEKKEGEIVDDPARAREVGIFLEALRKGTYHDLDADDGAKFYILGLSPNAARISVRFWYEGTVEELAERLGKHLRDIQIGKQSPNNPEIPGMWQLLSQTALQGKLDNVSPLLGGTLMRAILTGGKYPESLLAALIGRIRAEQDNKINYVRMSLLKGCLVRNHTKEVSVSLNKENREPAYLLGRLFAVLEGAQEDALGITTIKDRYFSSASATPRAVFPILLRLNQHHVSKGEHGGRYTRMVGEIMENLPAEKLPTHMTLEGQGLFAIGYYHQRNDFFKKQDKTAE